MAHEGIEIELKFPLKNPEQVKDFLNTNARPHSNAVFQKDTYFTPGNKDYLAPKFPFEWLRLRETGKGTELCYKHWYPENAEKHEYCEEYEIRVDGPMRELLDSLGFREISNVEKARSSWQYKDTEVAIDDVKGLGIFIEVEAMKSLDPRAGESYLMSVLKETGADVDEQDLRGYAYRMAKMNKK